MEEQPIDEKEQQPIEEKIRAEIKKVVDPELNLSIVDLGLIYGIRVEEGKAFIKMTLTSPACPVGPMILSNTKKAAESVPGITGAHVQLTFNPPWTPEKATEEIKAMFAQMM